MIRLLIITIFFQLFIGCSSNSISYVKEGKFIVKEGREGINHWRSRLGFKRLSFLNGMTMVFDILASQNLKESNFKKWFTNREKKEIEKCPYPIYIGVFSGRDFLMDTDDILNEVLKKGGKILSSHGFIKNFSFHPSYKRNSFNIYRFEAICFSEEQKLELVVPGFEAVYLN